VATKEVLATADRGDFSVDWLAFGVGPRQCGGAVYLHFVLKFIVRRRLGVAVKRGRGVWQDSINLNTQVARGIFISAAGRVVIKSIQFIKTVILARLLFPADFGLFAIAGLALAMADILFQTGFNQALVQERRRDLPTLFNAAWTINIIRGGLLTILAFFAAPLLGSWFDQPLAVPLIRMLAFGLLIIGFENVAVVAFQKNFQFQKKLFLDLLIVMAEVAAVISLALAGFGVWSLVLGSLANRLAAVALSFWLQPIWPRWSLDLVSSWHLLVYGKWIGALSIISFLIAQGDYIVIGKLLGPESLGYYQLAFTLALLPAAEFVRSIGNVLFPLYSRLAGDTSALRSAFIRATRALLIIPVPAAVGLGLLRTDIVTVIYGGRWLPMAPILTILAGYGLFKAFDAAVQPFFLGTGRPRFSTLTAIWQAVAMFAGILPLASHFGIRGVALAVFLGGLAAAGSSLWLVRRQINLGFRGLLQIWFPPLLAAVAMAGWILLLKAAAWPTSVLLLGFYVVSGAGVYFAVLFAYDRWYNRRELWLTWQWFRKYV